jgi:hypothetical protein
MTATRFPAPPALLALLACVCPAAAADGPDLRGFVLAEPDQPAPGALKA